LIEREWLATLSTVSESDVIYQDFCEVASTLGRSLREEHGCDVVIALTHMRAPNDERLAREVCVLRLAPDAACVSPPPTVT
jgi:5'-nucleotidase